MHTFAAAGAAFLICVLWFDLMFDVQVRGHDADVVPGPALASISGYYRRVTREAWPMNRLIAVVMLLTLLVILIEIVFGSYHWWIGWISLVAAASAIGLARQRTIPNASRLGKALSRSGIHARWPWVVHSSHG